MNLKKLQIILNACLQDTIEYLAPPVNNSDFIVQISLWRTISKLNLNPELRQEYKSITT